MKRAVLVAAIVALSIPAVVSAARTHKITLVIHSTPEAAQLLLDDVPRLVGVTPWAVPYEITGDCGRTQAIAVRWASGAEASVPAVSLCTKTGKRQQVTFERPATVAGLEVDLQVAYQQAVLAELQAIRRAAEDPPPPALRPYTPLPKTSAICVTRQAANGVMFVSCQ
jgi:hypothetical protein